MGNCDCKGEQQNVNEIIPSSTARQNISRKDKGSVLSIQQSRYQELQQSFIKMNLMAESQKQSFLTEFAFEQPCDLPWKKFEYLKENPEDSNSQLDKLYGSSDVDSFVDLNDISNVFLEKLCWQDLLFLAKQCKFDQNFQNKVVDMVLQTKSDYSYACQKRAAVAIHLLNLAGFKFNSIDFSNIKVRGAILNHANLEGANFTGADLQNADLRDAKLKNTDFTNTNLLGAFFTDWETYSTNQHIDSLCQSLDSKHINTSGLSVKIIDSKKKKVVKSSITFARTIEPSPNGKMLAFSNKQFLIKVVCITNQKCLFSIKQQTETNLDRFILWSKNNKLLILGGCENLIRIWHVGRKKLLRTITTQFSWYGRPIILSNDMFKLISTTKNWNSKICVWNFLSGKTTDYNQLECESSITSIEYVPNSNLLCLGCRDSLIRVIDLNSKRIILGLKGNRSGILKLKFSPTEQLLAGIENEGNLILWDFQTSEKICDIRDLEALDVSFTPDGQQIIVAGPEQIKCLRRNKNHFSNEQFYFMQKPLVNFAHSFPQNQVIAMALSNCYIEIKDYKNDSNLLTINNYQKSIYAMCFSPDGKQLFTGSEDGTISIHDISSKNLVQQYYGHISSVTSLSHHPKLQLFASGGADKAVNVWDFTFGKYQLCQTLIDHSRSISCLQFIQDGSKLVSGSADEIIVIWETDKFTTVQIIYGGVGEITALSISPIENRLALAGMSSIIEVWDIDIGQHHSDLIGHEASVLSLEYSLNGRIIASGSSDTTIRLWNAKTSQLIQIINYHSQKVTSISFVNYQDSFVSCSRDYTVKVFDHPKWQAGKSLYKEHHLYFENLTLSNALVDDKAIRYLRGLRGSKPLIMKNL